MPSDDGPERAFEYRAVGYLRSRGTARLLRECVSYGQAARALDDWQAENRISGGHVEMYVEGFGWVVAESEEVTG